MTKRRMSIIDPELRSLAKEIKRVDPYSRTLTQALRNAAVYYLKNQFPITKAEVPQ